MIPGSRILASEALGSACPPAHLPTPRLKPGLSEHSPFSGACPAPRGWHSWWPWSGSAPLLCCTAWPSGSHSLPATQPALSPTGTAPQPGWDTGPDQELPQSPPLSEKNTVKHQSHASALAERGQEGACEPTSGVESPIYTVTPLGHSLLRFRGCCHLPAL